MKLIWLLLLVVALPGIYASSSEESHGLLDKIKVFLNWSKYQLIGLPQELASQVIDALCSTPVKNLVKPTYLPETHQVECYLRHKGRNVSFQLTNALQVVEDLDKSGKLTVFITGYGSNAHDRSDSLFVLYDAYRCRGEQLLTVELSEAIHNLREWTHLDIESVGRAVAHTLFALTSEFPPEKVHVVGHSVGAHVAGVAGRRYRQMTGQSLFRITGLDPSLPCQYDPEGERVLRREDAGFVDVIHTNPRMFGISESIGDVDFYPNGHSTLEPGCRDVVCAHHRAVHYFAESVYPGNEESFLAVKCDSFANLDKCEGVQVPMGYKTPVTARGDHYLRTKDHAPFGLNSMEDPESCQKQYIQYEHEN